MKRAIFFLIILAAACPVSGAQSNEDVSFTAAVDKRALARSDQIVLTLKISGAQPSEKPRLPHLDGLEVARGLLSTSSKMEIVNGVRKLSTEYKYVLIPLRDGKLTIPPAAIMVGGKTYKTQPMEIEVRGAGGRSGRSPDDRREKPLFVELKADKETAYLDEQIILTFCFYQSNVQARDFQYTPPSMKGFRVEALGNQQGEVGTARVGGRDYNTITLRYALFPYQTGELKVGSAMLRCTVPGPRRRPRARSSFDDFFGDSFFFPSSRTPVNLATRELAIRVLPLPSEGRPEGEKISVGRYSMKVTVKPKKVKVGDPITVKSVIEGKGSLDMVSAPIIEADSAFKTYEPSSQTEITGRSTAIRGKKTFEEILVPLSEDIKEIPNIKFTYFDTDSRKYRTISKGPIPIEVLPAPDEGPIRIVELRPHEEGESIEILKKDIHFIKLSPGRFTPGGRTIFSSPVFILLNVFPAACFACLLLITRKRERMRSDFAYARRSRAYKRAMRESGKCLSLIAKGSPKEFYSLAETVLSRYIGDRLNLPGASVARDEAVEYMRSLGMEESIVSSAANFYRNCELAQYASKEYEPSDMRKSIEDLNEIIRSIEKKKK